MSTEGIAMSVPQGLPEMCFVFAEDAQPGRFVRAVHRGERGYSPTTYDEADAAKARALVSMLNERLGVSEVQAECMLAGSMFGWDSPAADPKRQAPVSASRMTDAAIAKAKEVPSIPTAADDERIFIDDGTYYIQGNINGDRVDTNGFLHRRCPVSMTTPGGYDCPGGYQRDVHGKWVADINIDWDDQSQSDCKSVGTFNTRNEAIAALWAHRHEALPQARQPNQTNVTIEAAWREAHALAEAKGEVAYGTMSEGKPFGGKILMANAHVVVQNLGRGAVIHNAQGLERIPRVEESVTVKYDANGRGAVSPRERTGQERIRGGR